ISSFFVRVFKKGDACEVLVIEESANIMIKMTEFVIQLAPYGILALMTNLVGTFGSNMLSAVASFILADYLAMALVFLLVYPLILKFIAKVNPFQFYKNIYPSILFAFTTSTSSATIPVSLRVMKRNVGVSEKTWGFTVHFGATANMEGMA